MSRLRTAVAIVVVAVAVATSVVVNTQESSSRTPAARAATAKPYTSPKTPWGDPDLQGGWTNVNENGIPFERPDALAGKQLEAVDDSELAELVKERDEARLKGAAAIGGRETGAGPVHWYEHYGAKNSRAWMVIDPADGRIPAQTPTAIARLGARGGGRGGRAGGEGGRADSWLDRSLYDRCITRGLPGSMMPAIYGNAYEIVQTPDSVAIRYEMIHETRIIPLDNRPRVSEKIREYLGDARGRWDGNTLVVETKNFTNRTHFGYNNRYNSEQFTLTERFTPTSPKTVQWEVTFNDPEVWTKPFTFTMPLTRDDSQQIFEYGCHEGNLGLEHILEAARAEERAAH
jgi:hypothetical protein